MKDEILLKGHRELVRSIHAHTLEFSRKPDSLLTSVRVEPISLLVLLSLLVLRKNRSSSQRENHGFSLFRTLILLSATTANLPTYSELALKAWNKTANKTLIYKPEDGSLFPSWSNAEICEKIGLDASVEETKMYVKALAELPRLILHDCGIACSKEVLRVLDQEYSDISKFMEFHFLRHGDAILTMNSQIRESLSTRADVSNSLEELAKDIWKREEDFCQWAKAFSISELWFCCEIETCFEGLRGMGLLPGGRQETKLVAATKERDMLKILETPGTLRIVCPENAHTFSLSPYHALIYTADKIAQQNIFYVKKRNSSPYQKFLRSFRKHTNYVRKSENHVRVKLSPDGQRLLLR